MAPMLLLPFFKGNSLESELGFVNYYHSHPVNRLLHTLAMPLLIFGMLTITYAIDHRLAVLFYIFYCAIILLFDYKTAVAYTILFGVLFYPATFFASQSARPTLTGSLVFLFGLILQGLGHYKFQQFAPAFHLFEAIFTTPVFLMLYLITDSNQSLWINVQNETDKWRQVLHNERKKL